MALTEDLIALEQSLGAHNYKPLDVALVRGEGVFVYDVDGDEYGGRGGRKRHQGGAQMGL